MGALGFKNPESKRHRMDADIKEVYLSTPFHCAARYGHTKICQLIMDNIGNKNPGDKFGVTPFHIAALYGHTEICKLMMDNLTDKNPAISKRGRWMGVTPFHWAASQGKIELCRLFLENITDKKPKTFMKKETPYAKAKKAGHYHICKPIKSYK